MLLQGELLLLLELLGVEGLAVLEGEGGGGGAGTVGLVDRGGLGWRWSGHERRRERQRHSQRSVGRREVHEQQ